MVGGLDFAGIGRVVVEELMNERFVLILVFFPRSFFVSLFLSVLHHALTSAYSLLFLFLG